MGKLLGKIRQHAQSAPGQTGTPSKSPTGFGIVQRPGAGPGISLAMKKQPIQRNRLPSTPLSPKIGGT